MTQCPVDVTWFPFDEQTCDVVFESWLLTDDDLKLNTYTESINFDYFREPEGWYLLGEFSRY